MTVTLLVIYLPPNEREVLKHVLIVLRIDLIHAKLVLLLLIVVLFFALVYLLEGEEIFQVHYHLHLTLGFEIDLRFTDYPSLLETIFAYAYNLLNIVYIQILPLLYTV